VAWGRRSNVSASNSRYTTQEVAARLFLSYPAARALLKSANIPYTTVGNAKLWDAESVERLIEALGKAGKESRP